MQGRIPNTNTHLLSLENEEYELKMSLSESFIEFKLIKKNVISDFYYQEKFDLSTINGCLFSEFKDLKAAYETYDKALSLQKVKLIKSKGNTIYLNLKIPVNIFEEKDSNLELKQHKLEKNDDGFSILLNEINEMKKKNNEMNEKIELLFQDYLKKKQEEESTKKKQEEIIKLQEKLEERLKLNDNVNYLNDFKRENIDLNNSFIYASGKLDLGNPNLLAVYSIIRNDEIIIELAFPSGGINIILYNALLKKKTNKIYASHLDEIKSIKHYYYSHQKKHFLLSSSNKSIKLWNISSVLITNELKIYDQNDNFSSSCLLFKDKTFFILSSQEKPKIYNTNGIPTQTIEESTLTYVNYIEAAYIKNKPYVLLSGNSHSESYDYKDYKLRVYKPKDSQYQQYDSYIINLFKKNEDEIYLMRGSYGAIIIFDLFTANEIKIIKLSISNYIYGLCSLNEKYFLVGDGKEMKIIDFDSKYVIRSYKDFSIEEIRGIKKIKIPEKEEFIFSYNDHSISLWK